MDENKRAPDTKIISDTPVIMKATKASNAIEGTAGTEIKIKGKTKAQYQKELKDYQNRRASIIKQIEQYQKELARVNSLIAAVNAQIREYQNLAKTRAYTNTGAGKDYTGRIESLKNQRTEYSIKQVEYDTIIRNLEKELAGTEQSIAVTTSYINEITKKEASAGSGSSGGNSGGSSGGGSSGGGSNRFSGGPENDSKSKKSSDSTSASGVNVSANQMLNVDPSLADAKTVANQLTSIGSNAWKDIPKSILHPVNLFSENEQDFIHKRYRYGVLNAYQGLNTTREFLFFTKPDLNIIIPPNTKGSPASNIVSISGKKIDYKKYLNGVLQNYPFWEELVKRYPGVVECLQSSLHLGNVVDPFNHLLENMVQSTIDVPGLSAELQETPSNMYGVNYTYRGSSEASDDGFDFSLEFKDTKYLHVYNFFKAYEEYETLKHHGVIGPWKQYIIDKILHDQYSIYKFVVGEDGETLVYYAKYYGVKSKSLPRDVFNSNTFDNGLSYSIDFNAAFVEDMNPMILTDFNQLSYKFWLSQTVPLDVYDFRYDMADNRPAKAAVIVKAVNGESKYNIVGSSHMYNDVVTSEGAKLSKQPGGYCYKLKWRGGDKV